MKNKFNLSYSLINAFWQYSRGEECGILYKAIYLDKMHTRPPSEAMQIGIYGEYKMTGQLPRSGEIPLPKLTKRGEAVGKYQGEITAKYKHVEGQVINYNNAIERYDVKIKETGKVVEIQKKRYKIKGIFDLFVEIDKKPVIIDIKLTGLIDDKWNDYGWATEKIIWKKHIILQAKMYKLLGRELGIEDCTFQYWVFANNNPVDFKILEMNIPPDLINELDADFDSQYDTISFQYEMDTFEAIPDVRRCSNCPIQDCKHRIIVPNIKIVDIY